MLVYLSLQGATTESFVCIRDVIKFCSPGMDKTQISTMQLTKGEKKLYNSLDKLFVIALPVGYISLHSFHETLFYYILNIYTYRSLL